MKSPFLLLSVVACLITLFLSIFTGNGKDFSSSVKSAGECIFDSAHYFFAREQLNEQFDQISVAQGSILEPYAPPFLVSGKVLGSLADPGGKKDVIEYLAEEGDTIGSLAEKFAISQNTIIWANDLDTKKSLKIGQKLVVLPVSGVLHLVRSGDTLSGIAQMYKVKSDIIADFNGLGEEKQIFVGDFLLIPGGVKIKIQSRAQVALPNSYFIFPVSAPFTITQGLHWYNAVDFSKQRCGDMVFATAAGTVQRTGYTNQGGNYVRIQHPNGAVTYYGHLSKIAVSAGKKVYQGQVVGYIGHTGHTIPAGSAGCHLHFDVRFASNPFAKYKAGAKITK